MLYFEASIQRECKGQKTPDTVTIVCQKKVVRLILKDAQALIYYFFFSKDTLKSEVQAKCLNHIICIFTVIECRS